MDLGPFSGCWQRQRVDSVPEDYSELDSYGIGVIDGQDGSPSLFDKRGEPIYRSFVSWERLYRH